MTRLGSVIAARLADWGVDDLPLERMLFDTTSPDEIAAAVDLWCRANLGAGIAAYEFFDMSSGSVHGVRLVDDRRVVVKGHRPSVDSAFLQAVAQIQRALAENGLPAPRPLAPPSASGDGHLTAEEMVCCDTTADPHDPHVRQVLAEGLATFIATATPHRAALEGLPDPWTIAPGALYPTPHSPRFDLDATAQGAEWIDDLAFRARERLASGDRRETSVVHGDWRIENVPVRDQRLGAIYDWDSIHLAPETRAVAAASTTFSVDWSRRGLQFPSPPEIAAFVTEYGHARATPFSDDERRDLADEMVASLAYGARCEHALTSSTAGPDSHDGLLRRLGARLLVEGLEAIGY